MAKEDLLAHVGHQCWISQKGSIIRTFFSNKEEDESSSSKTTHGFFFLSLTVNVHF